MKFAIHSIAFTALLACCWGAEPQNIPIHRLGTDFRLIGRLHVPLGDVVTLEGVVVEGPFKGAEGGFNLRVQTIQGQATQEDIQVPIQPFFYKWGDKPSVGGHGLPAIKYGDSYEMEGYATGGYVGVPGEVFQRGAVMIQTTGHYFQERFIVTRAHGIKPIVFSPDLLKGRRAVLQGKALSQGGKSCLSAKGWMVIVATNAPWPKEIEGKLIETWGMYEETPKETVYQLLDGDWRLVRLEDQVGRQVKLRGRARSLNGIWWFHYRGIDLYVDNLTGLPGWTDENHWRAMEIRGRLERATLPRVDQVSLKTVRDLKEYFIVREANWSPLPALLSLERPFDEPE